MRKLLTLLCLLAPAFFFAQYVQQAPAGGMVDWTNMVIREVGIGAPNPNLPLAAQRAGAIEAAKRVALRNLLERVKGVNVNSDVTIENAMVSSDVIRTSVEGTIRNFKVVGIHYKSDGSVEVEVEVPLTGFYDIFLPSEQSGSVGQVLPGSGTLPSVNTVYTGLIIDARGLGVRPALAPKILDEEGREVYGSGDIQREYALQYGIVGYEKDLNRARANERVKNNPLIIRAIGVKGANKTDVVISKRDADLIRAAAQNLNFLEQCKVMIVLD